MSEHWYARDGSPFYSITGKNGKERDVTIRDARKVGACPSVTTVLNVLAKPALTTWMVRQGILAALTLPRREDEAESDWLARVEHDSRQQATLAAEEGTRIHGAIESWIGWGGVMDKTYLPHAVATEGLINELFPGVADWAAEESFAHPAGFGGKVDLYSPSTGITIDFKTKDGDFTDGKKLAYEQHHQLAAYQFGLGLPENVCCNIFVSRTHPGKVAAHIWPIEQVEHGRVTFLATLELWKCLRKYNPTWEAP